MISYILGPNPTTQFTDNNGLWVAGGFVVTKDWNTRLPKATYFDPDGLVLRPNPFPLDSVGRQLLASQPVYYADDEPYYLQLLDANMVQIWESAYPYYPGSANQSKTNSGNDSTNLFINGQMRFFPKTSYSPIPASISDVAFGGWSYEKNGTNTSTTLSFERFLPDNIDIDASPTFFLHNVSTAAGTGETINTLSFRLQDVRTLAGEQITVSWNVRSLLAGSFTLSVNAVQHFGTGGAPSLDVTTNVMIINPTSSAEDYSATIILPTLSGKTIGTDGNDNLTITFTYPLNTNYNIQATNFYMKRGLPVANFPYLSYHEVNTSLIQNPATRVFNAVKSGSQPFAGGGFNTITFSSAPTNPQGWFSVANSWFQPTISGWWIISVSAGLAQTTGVERTYVVSIFNSASEEAGDAKSFLVNDQFAITFLVYIPAFNTLTAQVIGESGGGSVDFATFRGALITN
jgi:hypothetical protein